MNSKFIFVLTLLLYYLPTNAQEGWFWQNPLPQGNELQDVFFTDENNGWAVGILGTILQTTNGGTYWTFQTSGNNKHLTSVYFIDSNNGWVAGEFGKILNTTNGGFSWLNQTAPINDIWSVYFTDINNGWIVGVNGNICRTTNGGTDWLVQSSGTNHFLHSVNFTDVNNGWAVGEYNTILKTTNGGVTFIEEEPNPTQPNSFLLSQNFPNPFNPITKIKFEIPSQARNDNTLVTLKVYDVLGREVATLVNEEIRQGRTAGEYEVEFDSRGLPSGVYFYQLKAGSFVETKKMVLIR